MSGHGVSPEAPAARATERPAGAPRPRRRAAFVDYHRLVDACARSGCPVCRCVVDAATARLGTLLAEHVTDPEAWQRLAETRGFCAGHAAQLRQVPDAALGTAIVYQRLVERACAALDTVARGAGAPARPRRWGRLLGRGAARDAARPRRACPVCVDLAATEARYLDALLHGLGDAELGAAYAASPGLCVPHLDLALARPAAGPAAARLAALAQASLRRLADDLRGFIDRHDHRAAGACTPAEAEAWTAALARIAGRPELFGLHLDRRAGSAGAAGPDGGAP